MVLLTVRLFHSATDSFELELDENSPIQVLKKNIFRQFCVPPIQQCLVSRGKKLEEDFKISDYLLGNGSTVHVLVRTAEILRIVIISPGIKKFKLNLSSRTQVEDFRELVARNLPPTTPANFKIRYKGAELVGDKILGDYNMKCKCKVIIDLENT